MDCIDSLLSDHRNIIGTVTDAAVIQVQQLLQLDCIRLRAAPALVNLRQNALNYLRVFGHLYITTAIRWSQSLVQLPKESVAISSAMDRRMVEGNGNG